MTARRRLLMIDLAIAVVVMIVLVIVSPGLAIVGLIAILLLIGCGVSFLIDRRRARRPGPPARAVRPSARRPPPRTTRRPPRRY